MNQWTLPSQGLLSQNVEAVFDVLGSVAACVFLPSPRMSQRWRACLVQVLHLDGRPIVLYPRCPAHWMDVVRGFPGTAWSRLVKRKYTHRVGWV